MSHGVSDGQPSAASRPARILVVENDYFITLEMERSLTDAGFEVVGVAGTAEEALDLVLSKNPELAITDIRLSGDRDGIDAAIEISARLNVPSIFATAHGDPATRRRAEQAKPLGWLEKPYSPAALNAALAQA